jgi:hypothetical protein
MPLFVFMIYIFFQLSLSWHWCRQIKFSV